ncbi:MAG: hypothetical protein K0R75_769 [Paenibacillaceae bacterium]|nr:hypothetical protein [Paenibacillaceae bacterium]
MKSHNATMVQKYTLSGVQKKSGPNQVHFCTLFINTVKFALNKCTFTLGILGRS